MTFDPSSALGVTPPARAGDVYQRVANSLRQLLETVGLRRRARDVGPLRLKDEDAITAIMAMVAGGAALMWHRSRTLTASAAT
jgi:hypothetical protein